MQRWLLAFALAASISVRADPVKLIPAHLPPPIYPYELRVNGVTGKTKVRFTVKADGSVSDVKVIRSDHLLFTKASRKAVREWRFKPWVVTAGMPSEIETTAPMIFRLDGRPQLPMDINNVLGKLSCNSVNSQVAQRNKDEPQQQLRELSVFSYVSRYLSEGIATSQLSKAERKALINEFVTQIPQIVERCQADPEAQYADQLPESVRELL